MVMLGDGFHFIETEFKKEAINSFKKEFGHLSFNQLRDRMLYIDAWELKLVFRDSYQTLNSYNNLSILLVIEHFKPIMHEMPQQKQVHHCTSVYQDKEIRALLDNTRRTFINSIVHNPELLTCDQFAVGTFTMPKMSDLFTPSEIKGASKNKSLTQDSAEPTAHRIAACGLIRINYDFLPDLNGRTTNDMLEYSNPFKVKEDYRCAALSIKEVTYLRNDIEDFTEFRVELNCN
jgi:hypothetical protein